MGSPEAQTDVGKLCGQAPLKPHFSIPTPPTPICVQVANRAEFLGSGLLQHDCKVGTEQFIGVFAQNRPEVSVGQSAFRGINRLGKGNPVSTLGRAWGLTKNRDLGPWHCATCIPSSQAPSTLYLEPPERKSHDKEAQAGSGSGLGLFGHEIWRLHTSMASMV